MPTPLARVASLRRKAIAALFEKKFAATVRVTVGSATCENAAGASQVYERIAQLFQEHKVQRVALGRVGCAGRCDLEPVVTVISQGKIPVKYVKMTPAKVEEVFQSHVLKGEVLEKYTMAKLAGLPRVKRVISICTGAGCLKKNEGVEKAFLDAIAAHGLQESATVTRSACQGLCERGPIAFVYPDGVVYQKVTPEAARSIVEKHLKEGTPVAEYAWQGKRLTNRFLPIYGDVHFFGKQLRITLRNCGVIDPESLDEYFAVQGYEAIAKALTEMSPKQVVESVIKSGLRGRGGGGFPTGVKWQLAAAQGKREVLHLQRHEGDPGVHATVAPSRRPHILEGMMIGGFAIGASGA